MAVTCDHAAVTIPSTRLTNSPRPAMSFFGGHLIWPLRIMFIVSMPSIVRHAEVKSWEPLTRSDPPLDGSVIRLDDVVQVADGGTSTAPTKFPSPLQFRYYLRIRRVPVQVDDPRSWMPD
jgi:hypothetical protein